MAAKKAAPKNLEQLDPTIPIQREIALRGTLHQFVKIAWNEAEPAIPFIDSWHIGAICEHLQAIEDGQISRLIINIPPGCSKSRLTGLFWPLWAWIRKPELRFGFFSFDESNTLKQSGDALDLIMSPWFQARWGEGAKGSKAVERPIILKERDPARGNFYNTYNGWFFASSVEGKATGKHFMRQVIDDPLKPKAISPVTLSQAKVWLSETMASRWVHAYPHLARVIVMQRLHDEDTTGVALAEGGYEHLMLPMRFEKARACSTSIGFKDPRTAEGELLCPSYITEKHLAIIEKELMSEQARAAQLQQDPVPPGGNLFKEHWLRTWVKKGSDTKHLDLMMPPRVWIELPDKFDLMWQSWDFAFKETDQSDYVVGQVWGRSGGNFFLLWQWRDRADLPKSLKAIQEVSRMFPKARAKLVEDKANGPAVISTLKNKLLGLIEVDPEGGKESRANAVAPMHEAGNVYYPDETLPGNTWVAEHRSEMTRFPLAKNDDTVDSETQALLWGSSGFKQFKQAMNRLSGNDPEAARLRDLLVRFGR